MQNHSSYSDWADYDNFSPDITVEGSDSKLLPAYLSLIRLSDSAIQNLVSYFEAQEEPTMIVFSEIISLPIPSYVRSGS